MRSIILNFLGHHFLIFKLDLGIGQLLLKGFESPSIRPQADVRHRAAALAFFGQPGAQHKLMVGEGGRVMGTWWCPIDFELAAEIAGRVLRS